MKYGTSFVRNRAITKFRKRLPDIISEDYGRSDYYTAEQVEATLRRNKFGIKLEKFAFAMFCSKEAFNVYFVENDSSDSYEKLRTVIGDMLLHGRYDFKQSNLSGGNSKRQGNAMGHNGADGDGGVVLILDDTSRDNWLNAVKDGTQYPMSTMPGEQVDHAFAGQMGP